MPDIKLESMASEPMLELNGHKEAEEEEAEDAKRDDRSAESDGEMDVDEDTKDADEEGRQDERKPLRTVIKVNIGIIQQGCSMAVLFFFILPHEPFSKLEYLKECILNFSIERGG